MDVDFCSLCLFVGARYGNLRLLQEEMPDLEHKGGCSS